MRVTIELDDRIPAGGDARAAGRSEPDLDGGPAPAWLTGDSTGSTTDSAGGALPPGTIDAGGPPAWLVEGTAANRAM
ncbi:MAG: hypothetical protein M3464_10835 [Chloroflexota bacterium]|nr:hypothetical protein [Chloroflexota bacterium]